MSDLEPSLRAMVEAWVDETTPQTVDTDFAWRELEAAVRAGRVPPLEAGTGSGGSSTFAIVGTLVVAVSVAAAIAVASTGHDASEPRLARTSLRGHAPIAPQPIPVPAEPSADVPIDAPAEVAKTDDAPAPARAAVRPVRSKRAAPSPAPVDEASSLALELGMLREARAALRSGASARALALTDLHARRYPDSSFAEERGATEVMALCALGRSAAAQRKAAAFRARYPGSTFEVGLVEACKKPH